MEPALGLISEASNATNGISSRKERNALFTSTRRVDASATHHQQHRYALIGTLLLILVIGFGSAAAFLSVGITSARQEGDDYFEKSATDLITQIKSAWRDYEYAASFIHKSCRSRNFSRQDYRDLFEYLVAGGLEFQVAHFVPNITASERDAYEEEARSFYGAKYPNFNYTGFRGFNPEYPGMVESPRREMPWYMPIQWSEPVLGNEAAQGLDINDEGLRTKEINYSIQTGLPSLTGRIRLVQEPSQDPDTYAVALLHPGVNLTSSHQHDVWPRDLANIVVRINDLLRRSMEKQTESAEVYIYEHEINGAAAEEEDTFLGAVQVDISKFDGERKTTLIQLDEVQASALIDHRIGKRRYQVETIHVANKEWLVVVVAGHGTHEDDLLFVVLGGVIILVASVCLALWVYTNTRRVARDNAAKAEVEVEKAALILDSAEQAAEAERELNDFLAHEVRNPISAAMAACSFVKMALQREEALQTGETLNTVRDDVNTIEYSLCFVSDLLRSMLDMHRATNNKLEVTKTPIDVFTDVLEPCASMLTQRGGNLEVTTHCPTGLIVMSDRLRLKQVVLNLGRNSAKFCEDGFIRLSAEIVNGRVQLAVCDSGPGIPLEKRNKLFVKYQDSLDVLCQGTGIGLFLCQKLTEILGGDIHLDESYDSGIAGRPGCRFVIDLKAAPVDVESASFIMANNKLQARNSSSSTPAGGSLVAMEEGTSSIISAEKELPDTLSVLFVDDDLILRKLFKRTIQTVAPKWEIREAANGESAIKMAVQESIPFDLIFVDMYMTSVEKQLLGSETVQVLRQNGIESRICGLSANNKEKEFLEAGANAFTLKPFPCKTDALKRELCRILFEE